MGNANNLSVRNVNQHSELNGLLKEDNIMYPYGIDFPSRRYYNLYTDNMQGIKGDVVFIDGTSGFADTAAFTTNNLHDAWIVRGGATSLSNRGIFSSYLFTGEGNSSRFVIIAW